jgi:hypothetical protein
MAKHFRFNDGGRSASGYRGKTGDCVVRSIAIATGLPYQHIYDLVNRSSVYERTGTRKRGKSNARTGVYKSTIKRVMNSLGWVWTPTMQIGSGCSRRGTRCVYGYWQPPAASHLLPNRQLEGDHGSTRNRKLHPAVDKPRRPRRTPPPKRKSFLEWLFS